MALRSAGQRCMQAPRTPAARADTEAPAKPPHGADAQPPFEGPNRNTARGATTARARRCLGPRPRRRLHTGGHVETFGVGLRAVLRAAEVRSMRRAPLRSSNSCRRVLLLQLTNSLSGKRCPWRFTGVQCWSLPKPTGRSATRGPSRTRKNGAGHEGQAEHCHGFGLLPVGAKQAAAQEVQRPTQRGGDARDEDEPSIRFAPNRRQRGRGGPARPALAGLPTPTAPTPRSLCAQGMGVGGGAWRPAPLVGAVAAAKRCRAPSRAPVPAAEAARMRAMRARGQTRPPPHKLCAYATN